MITHKLGYKTGLKGLVLTAFLSMVSVGAYAADGAPVLDTGNEQRHTYLYLGDVPVYVCAHYACAYSRSLCRAYKV